MEKQEILKQYDAICDSIMTARNLIPSQRKLTAIGNHIQTCRDADTADDLGNIQCDIEDVAQILWHAVRCLDDLAFQIINEEE